MVELAVIGDTHVPARMIEIPEWVCERVAAADHTVHAGDFDAPETLERVRDLADGNLTAVAGNMDPATLGLDRVATLELADVRFVVTHGTGPPQGYQDRVVGTVLEFEGDVGIAGHTHEPLDVTVRGVRLLNPGSATGAPPATAETMMVVTAEAGSVDVDLLER